MHKYLQYIGNSVRYQNRNRWVLPRRKVIACDSFQGLPEPSADDIMHNGEHAPSIDFGRARSGRKVFAGNLGAFNIRESELTVLEGWFKDTLPGIQESISLLRMDGYYYSSTMTTLDILYEKVSPGGVILIDGYSLREGCRKAVLDFLDKRGLTVDICMTEDDNADAWFIKK